MLPIAPHTPWLAPLAGYSDLPFRLLCREGGCAAACTEMISAKGFIYNSPGTADLLSTCPSDNPLVVQIFGAEERFLTETVNILRDQGFTYFDLNAGCPVPKVTKTGSGAALLKDPDLLVRLVTSLAARCGQGKIGVKTRLGWTQGEQSFREFAPRLESAGAAWITLHPRWAKQAFSGTADWSCLTELKSRVRIPVIGSGDLFCAEDGVRCLRQTGIDGIMFARGALRDPMIFSRFQKLFNNEPDFPPSPFELANIVRRHVNLAQEHGRGRASLLMMRSIVPRYIRTLPEAKSLRLAATSCTSWDDLLRLADEIDATDPAFSTLPKN